jgi:hypothetical protein
MDGNGHRSSEGPRDDFRNFARTAVAKAAAALFAVTPASVGR